MGQRFRPGNIAQASRTGAAAGQDKDAQRPAVVTSEQTGDVMPRVRDFEVTSGLADIYREVCAQIRATDEISLKLLAAVPLATGIGITLLATAPTQDLPNAVRGILSLFAALTAFAIYGWERKNIATCGHFRAWAAIIERDYLQLPLPTGEAQAPRTYPHGGVIAPVIFGRSWGKTQSEVLLYWAAITSWLTAGVYTLVR